MDEVICQVILGSSDSDGEASWPKSSSSKTDGATLDNTIGIHGLTGLVSTEFRDQIKEDHKQLAKSCIDIAATPGNFSTDH